MSHPRLGSRAQGWLSNAALDNGGVWGSPMYEIRSRSRKIRRRRSSRSNGQCVYDVKSVDSRVISPLSRRWRMHQQTLKS